MIFDQRKRSCPKNKLLFNTPFFAPNLSIPCQLESSPCVQLGELITSKGISSLPWPEKNPAVPRFLAKKQPKKPMFWATFHQDSEHLKIIDFGFAKSAPEKDGHPKGQTTRMRI
jgi:hypothetical protein